MTPLKPAIASSGSQLILGNAYGGFDPENKEFVLTNVLTPRPWVNVMSNGSYGLAISQIGGGFSWTDNSQLRRITRWEQDLVLDSYGRWTYIYDLMRDQVQSTTFAPCRERLATDEVRHGLGYTVFRRSDGVMETSQTVFVPLGTACEHAIFEITNLSNQERRIAVGSYLEWFLGSQGEWHREFHRLFVSVEATESALYAWKRTGLDEGTRIAPEAPMVGFMSVSGLAELTWFSDKLQWVGREGRLDRPEGLVKRTQPIVTGRWDDPIAAFRAEVVIPAGQTLRFATTIGAEANRSEASASATIGLDEIVQRLIETRAHHATRYGSLELQSEDQAFDVMNNGWLPYQAEIGRMVARCAYYQQGGAYGFRDQLQDSLSLLDTDPAVTARQLEINSEAMYEDGGVRHWWHPGTKITADSHHCDTCLWLAFGVLELLDETGDLGFLEKPTRFLSRATGEFGRHGSMLEHCLGGIEYMLERRSGRGLPLIGSGDWNDGLSHAGIDGKGESVWLGMFAYGIMLRMAVVLDLVGQSAKATRFRNEAQGLQAAVEAYGWDGNWYIAGTSDNGQPFGSSTNTEGQIFLNPQTWATLTGIAGAERAKAALKSARNRLIKEYGALLLSPAYRNVDPYVGYITRYAPGLRENGGVYSHASTWAIQAFAQVGDLETAYSIYRGMLPALRAAEDADAYQAEPYVMPGNVDGPDSPYEGRAGWTWYTGSASWMRRAALHSILGIKPTLSGLSFRPSVPTILGNIRLKRTFRGDVFDISIERGSEPEIWVDGARVNDFVVPASGRSEHRTIKIVASG